MPDGRRCPDAKLLHPHISVAEPTPSLETLIARLPKVELHLHLEGSIRPETLRALVEAKGRGTKKIDRWIAERGRRGYRYRNFLEFLEAFKTVLLLLETPADYALATTRLVEWLSQQNVRYAEITLAAGAVLWRKQPLDAIFEAVAEAAAEAQARVGVRVQWIFDAVRHFGVAHVREVLDWAVRYRHRGMVAFGIGGDGGRGPAEWFAEIFREARDAGLHVVAHAGETVGPESIRAAVELLGAERIGHGLTAARDPAVMALLRERAIPLEVCPTSNVATGVLDRIEDHPLPQFLAAGLTVTLNSDDPALFGTSLEEEFVRAAHCFSLTRDHIVRLAENAIRAAFLPEAEKQSMLEELSRAATFCSQGL